MIKKNSFAQATVEYFVLLVAICAVTVFIIAGSQGQSWFSGFQETMNVFFVKVSDQLTEDAVHVSSDFPTSRGGNWDLGIRHRPWEN